MIPTIAPLSETKFEGLHRVIGSVAREKKFLASTDAAPQAEAYSFFRNILTRNFPYYIVAHGESVVGWCDVSPVFGGSRAHIGVLGMGLLPEYRHQGLGAQLLDAALTHAWRIGLRRVELTVRADNLNARRLYEKFGFESEGLNRRASLIDAEYQDIVPMAVLYQGSVREAPFHRMSRPPFNEDRS